MAAADTALSFLQRRVAVAPIATGLALVDEAGVSGRGLAGGEGMLVVGGRAAAKTQLAMWTAAAAAAQHPDGRVLWYDCGGGFDAERVAVFAAAWLAGGRGSVAAVLDRIVVVTPDNPLDMALSLLSAHQSAEAAGDIGGVPQVRLVVADGLSSLAQSDGAAAFNANQISLPAALAGVRRQHHVPVVITTAAPLALAKQLVADFAPSLTLLCEKTAGGTRRVSRVDMVAERASVQYARHEAAEMRVADEHITLGPREEAVP